MNDQRQNIAFIVGFGYIGELIAQAALREKQEVKALIRSENKIQQLEQLGIAFTIADLDQHTGQQLPINHLSDVFYTTPPQPDGETDTRLRYFLSLLDEPPASLIYISTSGVYGDYQGAWVTEDDPLKSTSPRSLQRIDAENTLLEWHAQHPETHLVILRSAGIYGPHRLPVDRLKRQAPLVKQDELHAYLNLIHGEDLSRICRRATSRCKSGEKYNVSDGSPTTMVDYLNHVAEQLELPQAPLVSLAEAHKTISPSMMKYLSESKRLSNKKLLSTLQEDLLYPNYIEGVKQAAREK
ncbi:Nucleoside-diphosphate-sugar epimerases [hydrothermal vent metagenome]|uniref:Nucleoside-diphosphate-sugar epimerases n=1 Tax=hydrothermal vent metagenome TaxID=652676 RepID=A0A3B0Z4L5_9ZZZZ